MNLFGRNKKSENTKKDSENSSWNKDLKRNIVNKTGSTQEGFEFDENTVTTTNTRTKDTKGTKKGLRLNIEKITQDQIKVLKSCTQENSATDLIKILKRTNKTKFKQSILKPLIKFGFFELTIPERPTSPNQMYRLTGKFVGKKVSN
ncbi:MAG TPA: hypothetical protein EYJ00_01350 [Gammaproteobacteria bacterium]|nr:hypothetical protein [Gammaproteobacteria bacterium]